MERRRSTRTRQRLAAEIVHEGVRYSGFLVDVSPHGAFVQMVRLLPPGDEVELRFTDDHLAPQLARAKVVRRRSVPAAALALMKQGIGIEWIEAPQFARAFHEDSFEIEIDPGVASGSNGSGSNAAESDENAAETLAPLASCVDESIPAASTPAATDAANGLASESAPREAPPVAGGIVAVETAPLVEETLDIGAVAVRAEVVVIDEGELGGFVGLAEALGASTLRMRWGAQADPVAWEAPPRVVIVSARVAMAVPLGDTMLCAGAIGVAVGDTSSGTLRARLRRQGYEYAVHPGAHPATLRLLLSSLLFRKRERRKVRRRAFGAQIAFWRSFRRTRATLLELSPTGGSLLLASPLPRGARLTVRVPAKHTGGGGLALKAVVTRCVSGDEGEIAGLRFEKTSARKSARLAALLETLDATGPAALAAAHARPASGALRFGSAERRRSPRVRNAQQALVIDERTLIARDVVFGVDLSTGGMRIEPHPRLARGATLRVALQPPGGAPPVLVRAEVARDEGARGLVLRFVSPSTPTTAAIDRMLVAAAEVERTCGARDEPEERLVLGTLVESVPLTL
jgi:hypothetical protein